MEILKILADNPSLLEAVKQAVLKEFSLEPERTDDAISDTQLGQMYRARLVGIQRVEEAFKKISRMRTPSGSAVTTNPAR